jgi:hypothetical protein
MSITVVWIIYKPRAHVLLLGDGRWFGFILLGTREFAELAEGLALHSTRVGRAVC